MKEMLKTWNLTLDWNREIATCDPNFYKWTQWIFLKLYDKQMVVRKEATVNWDPLDKTGSCI